jgi:uncharacterized protein YdaU (DUF1376 family)
MELANFKIYWLSVIEFWVNEKTIDKNLPNHKIVFISTKKRKNALQF